MLISVSAFDSVSLQLDTKLAQAHKKKRDAQPDVAFSTIARDLVGLNDPRLDRINALFDLLSPDANTDTISAPVLEAELQKLVDDLLLTPGEMEEVRGLVNRRGMARWDLQSSGGHSRASPWQCYWSSLPPIR